MNRLCRGNISTTSIRRTLIIVDVPSLRGLEWRICLEETEPALTSGKDARAGSSGESFGHPMKANGILADCLFDAFGEAVFSMAIVDMVVWLAGSLAANHCQT